MDEASFGGLYAATVTRIVVQKENPSILQTGLSVLISADPRAVCCVCNVEKVGCVR